MTDMINKFYTAFQEKDFETMASCYHADVTFYDPVFQDLKGFEVSAMWRMLIERAPELSITFDNIKCENDKGSARWYAVYPFGKTNRIINNSIKAKFEFKDGLIINHKDNFDFWKWSRMALGTPGLFLGWTPVVQNKVRKEAQLGLKMFIKRKRLDPNTKK